MLAKAQVAEHRNRDDCGKNHTEIVVAACNLRKVAVFDGIERTRAARHPNFDEIKHDLERDIVHHKREKRFVGVPSRFEERRNNRPYNACHDRYHEHKHDKSCVGHLAAAIEHARTCTECADKHLSFCADVPKSHLESRSYRKRNDEQKRHLSEHNEDVVFAAECTDKHIFDDFERRHFQFRKAKQADENQAADYACRPDYPRFPRLDIVSFYKMHQRFFILFHLALPPCRYFPLRILCRASTSRFALLWRVCRRLRP